jgi:hypothetical protein
MVGENHGHKGQLRDHLQMWTTLFVGFRLREREMNPQVDQFVPYSTKLPRPSLEYLP